MRAARSSEPPSEEARVPWRVPLAAGCALLVFLLFLPTLGFQFLDWDDRGVLLENLRWRGLGAEQIGWMFTTNHYGHYQPVTWLTYGLDYLIWGMNPRGYHLTSALFHAANTFLVWFVAWFLLGAALPGVRRDRPKRWRSVSTLCAWSRSRGRRSGATSSARSSSCSP
jgi:hypothetical protein